MNREQLKTALMARATSLIRELNMTLAPDGRDVLKKWIDTGVDRAFDQKEIPDTDAISKNFYDKLSRELIKREGQTVNEKGVRDIIALLCPGFWPFC